MAQQSPPAHELHTPGLLLVGDRRDVLRAASAVVDRDHLGPEAGAGCRVRSRASAAANCVNRRRARDDSLVRVFEIALQVRRSASATNDARFACAEAHRPHLQERRDRRELDLAGEPLLDERGEFAHCPNRRSHSMPQRAVARSSKPRRPRNTCSRPSSASRLIFECNEGRTECLPPRRAGILPASPGAGETPALLLPSKAFHTVYTISSDREYARRAVAILLAS